MDNPCISCIDSFCCSLLATTTIEERNSISDFLCIPVQDLFHSNGLVLQKYDTILNKSVCIFYDSKEHSCLIYNFRPRICRKFQCRKLNEYFLNHGKEEE